MVRIKNMTKAIEIKEALEELQDKTLDCLELTDDELNGENDVYNQIYKTIQTITDIIESKTIKQ